MPSVSGDTICKDNTSGACTATGTCSSCSTFNQADVDHIKSLGWNFIRLGVVWAGAQPIDTDSLDAAFVERLHAVLNLTDANGIHGVCTASTPVPSKLPPHPRFSLLLNS